MVRKVFFVAAVAMLLPTATVMAFHQDQCDPCHIPHMAGDSSVVPLWSGRVTASTEFTNYDSPTMHASPNDPVGSSLLCLACHDGAASHTIQPEGGAAGDMSGTHPLGILYNAALATADGELVDPDVPGSSPTNPARSINEDLLGNVNTMTCSSCHDIHESGLGGITQSYTATQQYVDNAPEGSTVQVDDVFNFNFNVPYLLDVPGIAYNIGWGGDATQGDDYDFEYAALCTVCHEK